MLRLTEGVKLSEHGGIRRFIRELAKKTGDPDIVDKFKAAEILHANSHRNFMDEDNFKHFSGKAVKLAHKLNRLLEEKLREIRAV